MKRGLLASWLLLCFLAGAAAEAPFAPEGRVVDHVVVMREHRPSRTRVVTSGADWFRVDLDPGGPAATTTYYDHPATLSTTVSRRPSGEYATLGIRRGLQQDRDASLDYPLKESRWSRGRQNRILQAVRLERRNVELNEVLPSGEMLSRRTWGLPE